MLIRDTSSAAIDHYLSDITQAIPDICLDLRYVGANNFIGEPIDGYLIAKCYLTNPAINALAQVQTTLAQQGLAIKIFDGYRPQRAVDHFVRWAEDLADTRHKARYYPHVDKKDLFEQGYIATHSGHSRGSTVDLTIINQATGVELDMGTEFDFFDPKSHTQSTDIALHAQQNRQLLLQIMTQCGFENLPQEWWHYTLSNEPYPDTYFDFAIARPIT